MGFEARKWIVLAIVQWRIFLLVVSLNVQFWYLTFICLVVSLKQIIRLELTEDRV
jgi:hypothetical protein